MKTDFLKVVFVTIFLFCIACGFAEKAIVVSTVGKVEVNRDDKWIPLSKDSKIYEGEFISTGFKSSAVIKYQDSLLKIGPLTRIALEKLVSSEVKDDVSIYISTGSIKSSVNHAENKRVSYTVRNPIAVASVRGTQFEFINTGHINCAAGAVAVFPAATIDPRRDLGVRFPADMPKDSKENNENFGKGILSNDELPSLKTAMGRSGIILTKGQSTSFTEISGAPNHPRITVYDNFDAIEETLKAYSEETTSQSGSNSKITVRVHFED